MALPGAEIGERHPVSALQLEVWRGAACSASRCRRRLFISNMQAFKNSRTQELRPSQFAGIMGASPNWPQVPLHLPHRANRGKLFLLTRNCQRSRHGMIATTAEGRTSDKQKISCEAADQFSSFVDNESRDKKTNTQIWTPHRPNMASLAGMN